MGRVLSQSNFLNGSLSSPRLVVDISWVREWELVFRKTKDGDIFWDAVNPYELIKTATELPVETDADEYIWDFVSQSIYSAGAEDLIQDIDSVGDLMLELVNEYYTRLGLLIGEEGARRYTTVLRKSTKLLVQRHD